MTFLSFYVEKKNRSRKNIWLFSSSKWKWNITMKEYFHFFYIQRKFDHEKIFDFSVLLYWTELWPWKNIRLFPLSKSKKNWPWKNIWLFFLEKKFNHRRIFDFSLILDCKEIWSWRNSTRKEYFIFLSFYIEKKF